MMQGLDDSFDAVMFISYHGSVGAPAGLSHTYNPRAVVEARIDGAVTGEAGINALVAAHYGVPVVLVTGDRCACEETAALIPASQQAVVKEHVSRLAAHSLHPDFACALIRERAERRCERPRRRAAAAGPRRPEVSVRTTDIAEAASWVRGVDQAGPRELRIRARPASYLPRLLRGHPADALGCGGRVTAAQSGARVAVVTGAAGGIGECGLPAARGRRLRRRLPGRQRAGRRRLADRLPAGRSRGGGRRARRGVRARGWRPDPGRARRAVAAGQRGRRVQHPADHRAGRGGMGPDTRHQPQGTRS